MIFTSETRERFRTAFKSRNKTAVSFVEASRNFLVDQPLLDGDQENGKMGAMCLLCLVEAYSAEDLIGKYEHSVQEALPKSNLSHALWAHIGSMIYDCLEDCFTAEQAARIQHQRRLANALLQVGKGNPHNVTNNWWGITHAGLILASLCLPENEERNQIISFANHRLRAFLHHFGPACLYHEGLGYQDYTLSQVLPALYALENHHLFSFKKDFPQAQNLALSLLLPSADIPAIQDQKNLPNGHGGYLCWNDAGHEWPKSNVAGLSIRLSKHAEALWSWFDQLTDLENPDKKPPSNRCGLYHNALCYPYGSTHAPLSTLPTSILDTRQGQLLYRTQWKDAGDLVLGVLARSTHVGGHSQDDAGSVRVIGMGYHWILGGGQNRPQADWQSVAIPLDEEEDRKQKAGCGAIFYEETDHSGFTLGLDLRRPRGAYCERYLRFLSHPSPEIEGALCILDQIDDHRGLPWSFQLTLSPQHRIHRHENGITLKAPDQSCMHLHFFTSPDEVHLCKLPETSRTFANGNLESYASFPVMKAPYAPRKHLSIYTLLTFSKSGHIPNISKQEGLAFKLDDTQVPHPFSSAISPDFRCNKNKGLCQEPLFYFEMPSP